MINNTLKGDHVFKFSIPFECGGSLSPWIRYIWYLRCIHGKFYEYVYVYYVQSVGLVGQQSIIFPINIFLVNRKKKTGQWSDQAILFQSSLAFCRIKSLQLEYGEVIVLLRVFSVGQKIAVVPSEGVYLVSIAESLQIAEFLKTNIYIHMQIRWVSFNNAEDPKIYFVTSQSSGPTW